MRKQPYDVKLTINGVVLLVKCNIIYLNLIINFEQINNILVLCR